MRQCFIISQPRAGSTLLQRLLATHPEIQTIGEPWLAIPFVYALREKGAAAEYIHVSLAQGFGEFVSSLPGGRATYFQEVRGLLERLQEKISAPGKTWFLDKTPRYHLILPELAEIFPDARFILLWRNPLAVAASILNTWKGNRFDLRHYEQDIYGGPLNLFSFAESKAADILEIRYEDLVQDSAGRMRQVTDFLGLSALERVALPENDPLKKAKLGDKTGINKFRDVSTASLEEWRQTFNSPIRRHWARGYLGYLGSERLGRMGYPSEELLASLNTCPTSLGQAVSDCRTLGRRLLRASETPPFFRPKLKKRDFV